MCYSANNAPVTYIVIEDIAPARETRACARGAFRSSMILALRLPLGAAVIASGLFHLR